MPKNYTFNVKFFIWRTLACFSMTLNFPLEKAKNIKIRLFFNIFLIYLFFIISIKSIPLRRNCLDILLINFSLWQYFLSWIHLKNSLDFYWDDQWLTKWVKMYWLFLDRFNLFNIKRHNYLMIVYNVNKLDHIYLMRVEFKKLLLNVDDLALLFIIKCLKMIAK